MSVTNKVNCKNVHGENLVAGALMNTQPHARPIVSYELKHYVFNGFLANQRRVIWTRIPAEVEGDGSYHVPSKNLILNFKARFGPVPQKLLEYSEINCYSCLS
jgi:hypothetical protein